MVVKFSTGKCSNELLASIFVPDGDCGFELKNCREILHHSFEKTTSLPLVFLNHNKYSDI
jgi:hypothetical protein